MVTQMAHYAELDYNNVVIQVVPGWDETEKSGMETILLLETGNIWKRTSYNTSGGVHKFGGTPFRKNYAGIGYTYDVTLDAFIPPKPFPSWVLNKDTCWWEAPVKYPEGTLVYNWNEANQSWETATKVEYL
jgi:hypothetical protein